MKELEPGYDPLAFSICFYMCSPLFIEMMVVLLIITVLLLIAVPNMVKNNDVAQSKGCDATINLLEAQAGAYRVEHETAASSLADLEDGGYVETITCPDQTALTLNEDGTVTKAGQ